MSSLASLEAQVRSNPDPKESARMLVEGIAKALHTETQGQPDPRKEQAFAQKLQAAAPALAEAVVAKP